MGTVTALEAKTRFGKLLERVLHGEEVIITKHQIPIARLIPENAPDLNSVKKAAAALRALQSKIKRRPTHKRKLTLHELKSAIAEGRR